jgi:hypothetical protein
VKRILRTLAIALTALALLWSAGWYIVADRLDTIVTAWVEKRRAQGWTATYAGLTLEGFPFAWRARIREPVLDAPAAKPPFRWSGPVILLDWKPWQAERIGFDAPGAHRLVATDPSSETTAALTSNQATGEIVFGGPDGLKGLSAHIDGAILATIPGSLDAPPDRPGIRIDRIDAAFDAAPAPRKGSADSKTPSARINASILGMTLPESVKSPLGRTIGSIALDATILGRLPRTETRDALDAWRNDGGLVEIDRFHLGWSRLVLDASGSFALDRSLQPVVSASGTISGHQETLTALTASGALKPGEALIVRMALTFLEGGKQRGDRPEIRVSLSIQDGWLYLGPVKLLKVPPILWNR